MTAPSGTWLKANVKLANEVLELIGRNGVEGLYYLYLNNKASNLETVCSLPVIPSECKP